jgi:hypothetical protein
MALYAGGGGETVYVQLQFCCFILLQETMFPVKILLPALEPTVCGMRADIATDVDNDW